MIPTRPPEFDLRQWIAVRTATLMFGLALCFLFCQAVLVVLWADMPLLIENALAAVDPQSDQAHRLRDILGMSTLQSTVQVVAVWTMALIWPIFVLESIFHWCTRPWNASTRNHHILSLLFCLSPSLRMCARFPELRDRIWLPGLGWRHPNRRLRARLQQTFSVPMIIIALMIMPVLIVEFFLKNHVAENAWLRVTLHLGTGVIWFAFAAEFILMFSVADKKIDYCKRHWLDLVIILLPFISFLRSLRILKATRASSLLRVSQLSKLARVYRLRGTAVKALRALVLLNLFQRLMGGPERSLHRLNRRLAEVEGEAKELRRQIRRLQRSQQENVEGELSRVNTANNADD